MAEASTRKTFFVALIVAVACAGLVSLTAVGLAERIQANKSRELMGNVLQAVGLEDPAAVEFRIVELDTGDTVSAQEIGPGTYDQREAAGDPELSDPIPEAEDLAELGRRERYAVVGLVREGKRIEQLILPVRGLGYGGMIRGFVVLDGQDLSTVRSIQITEHSETPGLGSEITRPSWRAQWSGKRVYDDEGELRIRVVQGAAAQGTPEALYEVDGVSGATITSESVSAMIWFWFGEFGFYPTLTRLREHEPAGGSDDE
jgi:Na+-transporting NADH:ubiquinone oxidoreductase subunit C